LIIVCFLTVGIYDGIQKGHNIVQKFDYLLIVKCDYFVIHLALLILFYLEVGWLGFLGNVK